MKTVFLQKILVQKKNSYEKDTIVGILKSYSIKDIHQNLQTYIIGDVDGGILQVRETNLKLSVVYRIACEYNCDKVKFFNIKEPFEEYRLHTMPYAMMADTVQVEEFVKKIRFDKRYINFCFD